MHDDEQIHQEELKHESRNDVLRDEQIHQEELMQLDRQTPMMSSWENHRAR